MTGLEKMQSQILDEARRSADEILEQAEKEAREIREEAGKSAQAESSRILEKSGRSYELKEATLYTTFRRLEKQGYVTSYWGNESSGPRRRYYSITGAGREYLQKRLLEWEEIKKLLDRLLDGGRKEE